MYSRKKNLIKYLAFLVLGFFLVFFSMVYAADVEKEVFTPQVSTGSGSSNSKISVDSNLSYWNKGDNSSIIGNYFTGYYHDSILGYFKTNWSTDSLENVRVVGSSSACGTSYGYKLGGYAYSNEFGFIDFDYNTQIFVYYCLSDKKLRGYAYSSSLGFQNFTGIGFEIETRSSSATINPQGTGAFVNDNTTVVPDTPAPVGNSENSNFTKNTIQSNTIEFESEKESLFYIIK